MTTSCLAVIPARFASSRCNEKPLEEIEGKSLVRRVWEQVSRVKGITESVIATDNHKVIIHAKGFGASAILTSEHHPGWIERVAEVVERYLKDGKKFDIIAVIPCDLPFVRPELIEGTIKTLIDAGPSFDIATAAAPIYAEDDFNKSSIVKVALGQNGQALYFSHAPIPFIRNKDELKSTVEPVYGDRHIDLYASRPSVFGRMTPPGHGMSERREDLDVLRFISQGFQIKVYLSPLEIAEPFISVDTPDDLKKALTYARIHLSKSRSIPTW